MINPGTVAAIAASLMAQGECLGETSELFAEPWRHIRRRRIEQFVELAWQIAREAEAQAEPTDRQPKPRPRPLPSSL